MGIFIILIIVMVSQLCTYVETHQLVHFEEVRFVVCHSYLNEAVQKRAMYPPRPSLRGGHGLFGRKSMPSSYLVSPAFF